MKIASPYVDKPHSPYCDCAACLQKASTYPHWKERRRLRLGVGGKRPAQCHCSRCRATREGEWEYEDNVHTYWRRRRQLRHGWPLDVERGEFHEVFSPGNYSRILNPIRHFHGITPGQVKKRKPRSWRIEPALKGSGWRMIDEQGNERIRFMRPNPRYRKGFKQPVKWDHIRTGYWVIRDGQGNYLDGFGNIVAPNISFGNLSDDQKFKIHVPFSGVLHETGDFY